MWYCVFLVFLPASLAFQLPFHLPFLTRNQTLTKPTGPGHVVNDIPRVAIIGAGAGGSSAAFWISKAKERFNVSVEVDVYEKASYIGGRSITVYPYGNSSLPPLELGASVFVAANKNLWRASDEFNLTRQAFGAGGRRGVWDGEDLVFTFGDSWWDTIKALVRYGVLAHKRTQQIVKAVVERYLTIYSLDSPNWDSIADISAALDYSNMTRDTATSFFAQVGVAKRFASELIEGATRVNYGQNLDDIHALGGIVSLATDDARGIKGGNFQLFEQFLKRSGAHVHLNTQVSNISVSTSPSTQWTIKSSLGEKNYKAVILAAPFHSTGIAIPPSLADSIPEQPYVHLHVTLLTTTSPKPNPTYFKQQSASILPEMTLTTYEGVRNGKKEPEFMSLSYHGLVREGEWAVKIFSKQRISDELLIRLFSDQVSWIYRTEWDAYPKLTPTTTFPPVKVNRAFYYVNAFEPFISTMETQTVAARNVVDLLLREEFGASICGSHLPILNSPGNVPITTTHQLQDFVLGWDC
ncbi:hypothetical protein C0993_000526 [Termitomyces sp. T159_Od127]|nr:hypothetical protein C0993_000526 [Termitomyces sp. T159_Od127]